MYISISDLNQSSAGGNKVMTTDYFCISQKSMDCQLSATGDQKQENYNTIANIYTVRDLNSKK